jgi:hypothetical protein
LPLLRDRRAEDACSRVFHRHFTRIGSIGSVIREPSACATRLVVSIFSSTISHRRRCCDRVIVQDTCSRHCLSQSHGSSRLRQDASRYTTITTFDRNGVLHDGQREMGTCGAASAAYYEASCLHILRQPQSKSFLEQPTRAMWKIGCLIL